MISKTLIIKFGKYKIIPIVTWIGLFCALTVSSFAKPPIQQTDTIVYNNSDTIITSPKFIYKNIIPIKESIREFYRDSLIYPPTQDCMGRPIVEFIIEKDGSLTNIRIVRDIPGCDEYNKEALRLVHLMNGKWKPAKKQNENVRYYMIVPVLFDLR